ncbi:MAG: type IV pilus biogenesis/stability protein PilW [Marinobacter sp.]|nr:type IV pilus biogenesis/stability protein PilW [Marinobacter sp.]
MTLQQEGSQGVRQINVVKVWLLAITVTALVAISGCVTTTDNPFAREVDRQKAEENFVQLGLAYIAQGNLDRSRFHLNRALEINPRSAGGLSAMGLLYQLEGEPELAEEKFRESLRHDPNFTRGRVFYGAFLFGDQRFNDARDQFARASRDTGYSDRAAVFFNLGRVEQELGNREAAAQAFRRATELNRNDARSLLALSSLLVDMGDYAGAERPYGRLVALIQNNAQLNHSAQSLWTGIRLARHQGDLDREASLALMLRNGFPESAELQQYRALARND